MSWRVLEHCYGHVFIKYETFVVSPQTKDQTGFEIYPLAIVSICMVRIITKSSLTVKANDWAHKLTTFAMGKSFESTFTASQTTAAHSHVSVR